MPENNRIDFNNIKFLFNSANGEIKKSDFADNSKLQRLFNIFNMSGNDDVLDITEIQNIWNTMKGYASQNGNSIFENNEVFDFLSESRINENYTQLEMVGVNDVFNFFNCVFSKNRIDGEQIAETSLTEALNSEEIKDLAVISLIEDTGKAKEIYGAQIENQGLISDFVNYCKELWDTDYASSRVNRYIMCEDFSAMVLAQACSDEGLTQIDYLEAKIDLAISMLPQLKSSSKASTKLKNFLTSGLYKLFDGETQSEKELTETELEIKLLKDALRSLTPDELTNFVQTVSTLSDDEYDEKASQVLENMILSEIEKKEASVHYKNEPLETIIDEQIHAPGTISSMEQTELKNKMKSFEETFLDERGVTYDPEAIADYQIKNAQMQVILSYNNKFMAIQDMLGAATAVVADGSTYIGDLYQLSDKLSAVFKMLYGNDAKKIQEKINELMGDNRGFNIVTSGDDFLMLDLKNYSSEDLVEISRRLQSQLNDNLQILLDGKTFEERTEELKNAYCLAYGAKNAQKAADAFIESQQEGIQTVKTTVTTIGMAVTIAGQIVPGVGQAASAAMIWGGTAISTLGGVAISATENYTKAGDLTKEDRDDMLLELTTSLALVASGRGIGKISESVFKNLIIKNCPKFMAWISEVGIDAGMSLISTYAITGQLDLSGEGIAQLQQLLVGIISAKTHGANGSLHGGFKAYLNARAYSAKTNKKAMSPDDLMKHLKDDLGYSPAMAQKCVRRYARKPELQDKLLKMIDSPEMTPYMISALLKYADSSNIDILMKTYSNKNLYGMDYKGNCSMAGFDALQKCINANPQFRNQLLAIASNNFRPHQDIVAASELMKKYPNRTDEITELLTSNPNIKVGYDINNVRVSQIDNIMAAIDANPQLKTEIMAYMKVQRRSYSDTSDPTAQLSTFIKTLQTYPQNRDFILELAKNHNLEASNIWDFTYAINTGTRYMGPADANTILMLSGKSYTQDGIIRTLRTLHKYPKMAAFMDKKIPSYKLIDSTPDKTSIDVLNKRFGIRDKIEQFFQKELGKLRSTLGDDYYQKIRWEDIIPDGASQDEVRKILDFLNYNSKFFARTATNESCYGKNIQWASKMGNIADCASCQISEGANFDDVINYVASDYRAQDEATTYDSNTGVDDRRSASGVSRRDLIYGWEEALTPTTDYVEYHDRFNMVSGQKRTYNGIELTSIAYGKMYHPKRENIAPAMDIVRQRYDELMPLFSKVANNQKLSPDEVALAHDKISEMYFLMSNVMPWNRGSNGICDVFMRSMYKSLGIDQPALKRGVSLDLEAFTMDITEYKQKWNTFFEKGV